MITHFKQTSHYHIITLLHYLGLSKSRDAKQRKTVDVSIHVYLVVE